LKKPRNQETKNIEETMTAGDTCFPREFMYVCVYWVLFEPSCGFGEQRWCFFLATFVFFEPAPKKGRSTFASTEFPVGVIVLRETQQVAVKPRKTELARTLKQRCGSMWNAWYAAIQSINHTMHTQLASQLHIRSGVHEEEKVIAQDL